VTGSEFEPIGSEVKWEGGIVRAGSERFRYPDGDEVTRDKVWHPGAVGILALDDEHVWLTRQPRDERVWLYLATELTNDSEHEPEPGERIEIVPWPLTELDDAIEECEDSKSLIALLWLAGQRRLAYGLG
jgi:hypothetical protein